LELSIEGAKVESLPPFILDVYDYDLIGDNDFICRCLIPIKDAAYVKDDEEEN